MKLVLISPVAERPDEIEVLVRLFEAGLERYHVRRPGVDATTLGRWIERVPVPFRKRLVLHQCHELADRLGLGGAHWREAERPVDLPLIGPSRTIGPGRLTSSSCHRLAGLRAVLGRIDSVFFGPVFGSISKPGYGPRDAQVGEAVGAILQTRDENECRTTVLALGGVSLETAPRALALGFDGVAVLGAVWQSSDPVAAFTDLSDFCRRAPLAPIARIDGHHLMPAGSKAGAGC